MAILSARKGINPAEKRMVKGTSLPIISEIDTCFETNHEPQAKISVLIARLSRCPLFSAFSFFPDTPRPGPCHWLSLLVSEGGWFHSETT